MSAFRDLTNQRFGRLITLYPTKKRSKWGHIIWKCICDCGNIIEVRNRELISGNTRSCGCLNKEKIIGRNPKHGDSPRKKWLRLYRIWVNMKRRCLYLNATNYKYYGGRDISVCDEWQNNYLIFKFWAMSHGYKDNLVIDRINNDGNYEPSNCQWITKSENSKKSQKERKKVKCNLG